MEEITRSGQPINTQRPRSSQKKEESYGLGDIDKKRLFFGVIIFGLILGGLAYWGKVSLPNFLAMQQQQLEEKQEERGSVAGEADINLDGFQTQIDEIKKDVTKIRVEDVKEQEAVKKILSDLDELIKKATESAKIFDVKGNLCEEAKKKFCE